VTPLAVLALVVGACCLGLLVMAALVASSRRGPGR